MKQVSSWKQAPRSGNYKKGFLCLFIFLVIGMTGCGKKDLPLPPPEEIPPGVTDLTANINGQILTLSWSIPEGRNADQLLGYKIYRSANSLQETDCRGCPMTFRLLGEVMADESITTDSGNRKMSYSQTIEADAVEAEKPEALENTDQQPESMENQKNRIEYQYKVVGYTEYKVRSPDSNVILVDHQVGMGKEPTKGNREE